MKHLIATEREDQIALVEWASYHTILKRYMFHIPNEGKRHPIVGHNLVRMGLKKGVADFFLAYPSSPTGLRGRLFYGLFLELKRRKLFKVSKEQQIFLDDMFAQGYAAHIAYGFDEGREIILNYLNERK